jgi:hypothetical protein
MAGHSPSKAGVNTLVPAIHAFEARQRTACTSAAAIALEAYAYGGSLGAVA